ADACAGGWRTSRLANCPSWSILIAAGSAREWGVCCTMVHRSEDSRNCFSAAPLKGWFGYAWLRERSHTVRRFFTGIRPRTQVSCDARMGHDCSQPEQAPPEDEERPTSKTPPLLAAVS